MVNFKIAVFSIEFYFSYLDFIVFSLLTLFPLLVVVAFFTLAERKAMASIQRRKGPNIVGVWGVLQPIADGLKLVIKEIIIPTKTNNFIFIFGPAVTLFLSFFGWAFIPFDLYLRVLNLNTSILFVLVISSLGVYGILLSGWGSNSKYALFGALRSVSQMISYEVSISLIIIPIVIFSGSLSLNGIIIKQSETVLFFFPLLPLAIIFFISILAETNRAPFDLPEAEAELVAGYNVEYSAITFAAFFLGEYSNILLMSSLFVIFFLGGGLPFLGVISFFGFSGSLVLNSMCEEFLFSFKIIFTNFLFIFIRANLPRFRFDQLMTIGWKIFLPVSLSFILFYSGILFATDSFEINQLPNILSPNDYIYVFSTRF